MIIYCVQAAGTMHYENGYGHGLLEAEHTKLLVSFMEYTGLDSPIQRPKGRTVGRRKNVKARRVAIHPLLP